MDSTIIPVLIHSQTRPLTQRSWVPSNQTALYVRLILTSDEHIPDVGVKLNSSGFYDKAGVLSLENMFQYKQAFVLVSFYMNSFDPTTIFRTVFPFSNPIVRLHQWYADGRWTNFP